MAFERAKFVRSNRDIHGKPMQTFEIDGRKIKTNLGDWRSVMWDGWETPAKYTFRGSLKFGESTDEAFEKALDRGFTEIRFVETSTMTRGFHNVYIWCKR